MVLTVYNLRSLIEYVLLIHWKTIYRVYILLNIIISVIGKSFRRDEQRPR